MAVDKVKAYFKQYGMEEQVKELTASTATVELAAEAVGVIPARIAKTLSFKRYDECVLVVAAGDTKIDNRKFKEAFGVKAKMLSPDEVLEFTGHAVGDVEVYLDDSLKRFDTVFPAAGSSNSMIELSCDDLFQYSGALSWVDVCRLKE